MRSMQFPYLDWLHKQKMLLLWLGRYACNFGELQRNGSAEIGKGREGDDNDNNNVLIILSYDKDLSEQVHGKLLLIVKSFKLEAITSSSTFYLYSEQ